MKLNKIKDAAYKKKKFFSFIFSPLLFEPSLLTYS
jgi:hypothetical protein